MRFLFCGLLLGMASSVALAQQWYAGAVGGYGYAPSLSINGSPYGSASTGIKGGAAFGVVFGTDQHDHWGGEIRYLYRQSDLKLSSGGTSVTFPAVTNLFNVDFLWHAQKRESPVRAFLAFGAGMKFLDGTGAESATQPLGRFAALTNTTEALAAGDFGGGVKVRFSRSWEFRAEVRDYLSPSPSKVITAYPPASIGGYLNDIITTASIGYRW